MELFGFRTAWVSEIGLPPPASNFICARSLRDLVPDQNRLMTALAQSGTSFGGNCSHFRIYIEFFGKMSQRHERN